MFGVSGSGLRVWGGPVFAILIEEVLLGEIGANTSLRYVVQLPGTKPSKATRERVGKPQKEV